MRIVIIAVDKLREPYIREGCALYVKRLQPFATMVIQEVKPAATAAAEGEAMLRSVGADDTLWALDQRGRILSSNLLAASVKKAESSGRRRLALAIGGARGLADKVLERAALIWSLSHLTFLHEMARLIALEQLYRAIKINRGEPYHK